MFSFLMTKPLEGGVVMLSRAFFFTGSQRYYATTTNVKL